MLNAFGTLGTGLWTLRKLLVICLWIFDERLQLLPLSGNFPGSKVTKTSGMAHKIFGAVSTTSAIPWLELIGIK
jgi:hypothetical protein